jgi:hypothetical protein
VQAGETIMDAYDSAAVLICSFPTDASPQTDATASFLLLVRAHLLDDLLAASQFQDFQFKFVVND